MLRLVSHERNRPQYVHQHRWIAKIVMPHQRGQTRKRMYLLTLFICGPRSSDSRQIGGCLGPEVGGWNQRQRSVRNFSWVVGMFYVNTLIGVVVTWM